MHIHITIIAICKDTLHCILTSIFWLYTVRRFIYAEQRKKITVGNDQDTMENECVKYWSASHVKSFHYFAKVVMADWLSTPR